MGKIKNTIYIGLGILFLVFLSGIDPIMGEYSEISKINVVTMEMAQEGKTVDEIKEYAQGEFEKNGLFGQVYINGENLWTQSGAVPVNVGENIRIEVRTKYRWKPLFGLLSFGEQTMVSMRNK